MGSTQSTWGRSRRSLAASSSTASYTWALAGLESRSSSNRRANLEAQLEKKFCKASREIDFSPAPVRGGFQLRVVAWIGVATLFAKVSSELGGSSVAARGGAQLGVLATN